MGREDGRSSRAASLSLPPPSIFGTLIIADFADRLIPIDEIGTGKQAARMTSTCPTMVGGGLQESEFREQNL